MPNKIVNASAHRGGLSVSWENGEVGHLPFFWLRDHATDEQSFDSRSQQREVITSSIDDDIAPLDIRVSADGELVELKWPDIDVWSGYASRFLMDYRSPRAGIPSWDKPAWDAQSISERNHRLSWEHYLAPDGDKKLLSGLARDGFVMLTDCPTNFDTIQSLADLIGYVRHTIFGGLWDFEANEGMADSAYTPRSLEPHTDGTYSHDAPGIQVLACWVYHAEGGDSRLVDGLKIAGRMAQETPELFELLKTIPVPGRYAGDGVELIAERPVFRTNPRGEVVQVSYNNADRAPFRLDDKTMGEFYRALRVFHQMANSDTMHWRHILQPGELIVFDNWRVLHARDGFRGQRKMAGCYLNHEDFESVARKYGISDGICLNS